MMKNSSLWISVFLSGIFPILIGFALADSFSDWRWSHYPFHAMVESVGAVIALIIATLMIIMVQSNHLSRRYIIVASALTGMGLLDGFHAVLYAGSSFVWLHSVATMIGGIVFAAVWIPEQWLTVKRLRFLLGTTITVSLAIGITSIALPEILPTMVVDGRFSLLAKVTNFIGGLGFITGTFYFVYTILHINKERHVDRTENIVFANHCLLFGIAGLLFETSELWDSGWWWWHVLRLFAYCVVLVYVFILFKKGQDALLANEVQLEKLNRGLERSVQERTQALRDAQDELIRKERLATLGQVTATVSHELRNPLGAMRPSLYVINKKVDKTDERLRGSIETIDRNIDRCDKIIDDLLGFARIEELERKFICIDEWLESIIDEHDIPEYIRVEKDLYLKDVKLEIDGDRFRRAIINVVDNACHAMMGEEDANVSSEFCLVFKTRRNDRRIEIIISDNGGGIPIDVLGKIFEPLFSTKAFGVGLGMPIVKQIVELHGGGVEIDTNEGIGTAVTMWLPVM